MVATVRAVLPGELESAAAMRAQMAVEMGRGWDDRYPGWRERFAEYWRARQRAGTAQVFFAEEAGRLAGMAIVSLVDDYRSAAFLEPRGYVNGVYVVPL